MMVQAQPVMMAPSPIVMGNLFAPIQVKMGEAREANYFDMSSMMSIVMDTAKGHQILYQQAASFDDSKRMMGTCGCCPMMRFRGPETQVKYKNDCQMCSHWETVIDGEHVGNVQRPGCMENGIVYCLCPCLTCSGTAKYLEMHRAGSSDAEIFTLRKELFPCWPCMDCCCSLCGSCGICCQGCYACKSYFDGNEYRMLKQSIYPPLEEGDQPVGEIVSVHRASPQCCCYAELKPVRITMQVPASASREDVANLGLVALFYQGTSDELPCNIWNNGFRMPTGVSCLDTGLGVKTSWRSFEEVMNADSATKAAQEDQ
jgi:hypothetical protein